MEEPLDEGEGGEWKVALKLNIKKTKIMASGPITSWQIDGETMESVAPKLLWTMTATIKLRHLLFGRKVMTNLDTVLKSRHYFANKSPSSQGYGFYSMDVRVGL